MGISKKLETIYHNGQPDGIRSIRRSLSTMTTYVIPRPLLSEAKNITGINRHGIYYLINESEDNRIAQIYIGQTRNGILRLDDHNRSAARSSLMSASVSPVTAMHAALNGAPEAAAG